MPRELIRQERLLIVVRVTRRQLPSFPAKGWLAVEVFSDETAARLRFHALRLPLESLKLGAVLVHALTTPDFEHVEYQKTVISKDADFWELQQGDIIRANEEQQAEWNEAIRANLEEFERKRAEAQTSAALKRASRQAAKAKNQRPVILAAAAGFVAVAAIGVATMSGKRAPEPDYALQQARRGLMTVIMADRDNPNILIEYELKDDGSRRVVRRLTQAEAVAISRDDGMTTQSAEHPKSLVDALNSFFAVRQ